MKPCKENTVLFYNHPTRDPPASLTPSPENPENFSWSWDTWLTAGLRHWELCGVCVRIRACVWLCVCLRCLIFHEHLCTGPVLISCSLPLLCLPVIPVPCLNTLVSILPFSPSPWSHMAGEVKALWFTTNRGVSDQWFPESRGGVERFRQSQCGGLRCRAECGCSLPALLKLRTSRNWHCSRNMSLLGSCVGT